MTTTSRPGSHRPTFRLSWTTSVDRLPGQRGSGKSISVRFEPDPTSTFGIDTDGQPHRLTNQNPHRYNWWQTGDPEADRVEAFKRVALAAGVEHPEVVAGLLLDRYPNLGDPSNVTLDLALVEVVELDPTQLALFD